MSRVKISVKNLVEFVLRGGSIDGRFSGPERALEGARIHRKLQKAGGEAYKAEQFLSIETEYMGRCFLIEGRADGVIIRDDNVTIDEIKTTMIPLELIEEDYNQVHWAQAICYGYIYCNANQIEDISIQLTYFNVETEQIKRFVRRYTIVKLAEFFNDLLYKYKKWADFEIEWKQLKTETAGSLKFPFEEYRKGQRELAVGVYRTVKEQEKLFCQAPTGIGKTISTIFPSIKAVGEGMAEKIFYLTAKTTTRYIAENALNLMRHKGLRHKSIILTAKDKICPLEERSCNPEFCEYANGHFNRVNDVIFEIINKNDNITRDLLEEYSEKYKVCPFELGLDLTYWCDSIICDYNYVFDPISKLKRFFSEGGGSFIFLVDESHNLVDRAREMYSAGITKSDILGLRHSFDKKSRQYKKLSAINGKLLNMRRQAEAAGGAVVAESAPLEMLSDVADFVLGCEEWLKQEQSKENMDSYFALSNFLKIAEFYDERYVTFIETRGTDTEVQMYCIDPSYLLGQCMEQGTATIMFSATLTPLDYFASILGGSESSKQLTLPSPFCPDNLCLMVANRISTKYKNRQNSIEDVADMIYQTISAKKGNYMVFFPSYKYMGDVFELFSMKYTQINTLMQSGNMKESERAEFLERFEGTSDVGLLGFCVLGGVFSEGIDLEGDRLIGAIVVGVGLPQINRRQDIIMEYFNDANRMGFEYAYQYPGMNKVMQAAGRVIRGDHDRGVVLLIDERFTSNSYRELFPAHWNDFITIHDCNRIDEILGRFWN